MELNRRTTHDTQHAQQLGKIVFVFFFGGEEMGRKKQKPQRKKPSSPSFGSHQAFPKHKMYIVYYIFNVEK